MSSGVGAKATSLYYKIVDLKKKVQLQWNLIRHVCYYTYQFFGLSIDDNEDAGGSNPHWSIDRWKESNTSLASFKVAKVTNAIPIGCLRDFSFSSWNCLDKSSTSCW